MKNITVEVVELLPRTVLVRRGKEAREYFAYCEEVGCEVWNELKTIAAPGEPLCLWLPERFCPPGTSEYVQGAVVGKEDPAPEGYDRIELPAATYLRFRGEPFRDEDYGEAIEQLQSFIAAYDPEDFGYAWDGENPRIQLEPLGERGYIEMLPVKRKSL